MKCFQKLQWLQHAREVLQSRCLKACLCKLQEILEIEQLMDESMGLELNEDNLDSVLDEIRPYLVGAPD